MPESVWKTGIWALSAFAMSTVLAQQPAPWSTPGRYIGSQICASCHKAESEHFHENGMSRALETGSKIAIADAGYSWTGGGYAYSIRRLDGKVLYRVTGGGASFEAPIEYAFGQGKAGQTYLFEANGSFYESHVSYYVDIQGLDLTFGAPRSKPTTILEAAGRKMSAADARECFGCHTTGARSGDTLQLANFESGVQCEGCHGPGGAHVDGIRAGKRADAIRSLRNMNPQQTNEFCGACHRTWETVVRLGIKGPNNVRFQPYRLANSDCFSLEDRRIACTACHNPHAALITTAKAGENAYDANCLACHNRSTGASDAKICPKASAACVSCHVARVEAPGAHHAFADHWFRVVRANAAYPD